MLLAAVLAVLAYKVVFIGRISINVAKEKIITNTEDDVSADRLKNAAATKKLAIFDAFEILNRIQAEQDMIDGVVKEEKKTESFSGFAERRSK